MDYETEHPYQSYDPDFKPDEVMMRLHQLQNRIASTISKVDRENGIITEKMSTIEQTVDEIGLEVYYNGPDGESLSRIQLHSDQILQRVEKDGVIAAINLSPETITIAAENVDLIGYVTFTSLETPGQTVIDGGNIKTESILMDRLWGRLISLGNGVTTSRMEMFTADDNYHYILSDRDGSEVNGGLRIIVPNGPLSLVSNPGTGVYITDSPLVARQGVRVDNTAQFNNDISVAGTASIAYLNVTSSGTTSFNGGLISNSFISASGSIDGYSLTTDGAVDAGALSSYGYFRYAGDTSNYFRVGSGSANVYVNGVSKASWASLPKVSVEPSGDGVLDGNEFGVNNGGSMQPTLTDFFRNVEVNGERTITLDENFLKFVGDYDVFFSASSSDVHLKEKRNDSLVLEGTGTVSLYVIGVQRGKENIVGYSFKEVEDDMGQIMRDFEERRVNR